MKDTTGAHSNRFNQPPDLTPIKKKLHQTISLKSFLPRPDFQQYVQYGFSDFDYTPKLDFVKKRAPEISFKKNLPKAINVNKKRKHLPMLSHIDLELYWDKFQKKNKSIDIGKIKGRNELRINQREPVSFLQPDNYKNKIEKGPFEKFWYKKKSKLLNTPLEEIFKDNLKIISNN